MAERIEEQIAAVKDMQPEMLQGKLVEILTESPALLYDPFAFLEALTGVEIPPLDEDEKEIALLETLKSNPDGLSINDLLSKMLLSRVDSGTRRKALNLTNTKIEVTPERKLKLIEQIE